MASAFTILFFILTSLHCIKAQTFQNGSFEITTAPLSCRYNLPNTSFNSLMSSVNAFGSGNECDILIAGCMNPSIQNGLRSVGIANMSFRIDEIALNLTSPLSSGDNYTISFWSYSAPSRAQADIEIGSSITNNSFGNLIYTATTVPAIWTNHTFTFIAPNNAQYITVRNVDDGSIHWNHIDNFEFLGCLQNFDLGNDTILCHDETLTLDATSFNATYLWQDNSTSSTFEVTQAGTYWVKITDSCGSVGDTLSIGYYPSLNLDLGSDTSMCQDEILVLDASTPNASYLWQDNSTSPTFTVNKEGIYWVEVTTENCISNDTIEAKYNTLPTIDFGMDTIICQNETLTLDVSNPNASYRWQDNSTNPIFSVDQEGTYWVEVIVNNCIAKDTISVISQYCEVMLEMPNFFTPNFDGTNDFLTPIVSKGITSLNFIIYNRWGNKVYETRDHMINWDGQGVSSGTYFWIVRYTDINGTKNSLRGYVEVIK